MKKNYGFKKIIALCFVLTTALALKAMQENNSNIIIQHNNVKCSEIRKQLKIGLSSNNPEMIIDAIDKFLDLIPLNLQEKVSEAFYHSLLYIFFLSTGYEVHAERPSGEGFSDIMIIPENKKRYYIFEFKIDPIKQKSSWLRKDSAYETMISGMKQIFDNDYYGMYHQHGVPFTFFSVLFAKYKQFKKTKEKNIDDEFKNVSSLVLGVKPSPVSLRLTNIRGSEESVIYMNVDVKEEPASKISLKHTGYEQYLARDRFDAMHVRRLGNFIGNNDLPDDNQEHINLKNIREALEVADLSKALKNIECLLKSIPCNLRETSSEYYKALMLAIFYAAGCDVSPEAGFFIINTPEEIYKLWCRFGIQESEDKIQDAIENVFRKYSDLAPNSSKKEIWIGLNINQPTIKSSARGKRKRVNIKQEESSKVQKITKKQENFPDSSGLEISQEAGSEEALIEEKKEIYHRFYKVSRRELQGYALLFKTGKFFSVNNPHIEYNFDRGTSMRIPQSPETPKKEQQVREIPSGAVPVKLNFGT